MIFVKSKNLKTVCLSGGQLGKVHDCDQGCHSHGSLYRGPNEPAGLFRHLLG